MFSSLTKNKVIILFYLFISLFSFSTISYKIKIYNENKKLFEKTIFQEAKAHFENLKVYRTWNTITGGTYIHSTGDIKPNEYLVNNQIFTKNNKELVKVSHAWMTKKVAELLTKKTKYEYNISSQTPINPINLPKNSFEKEALDYFKKNSDEYYFSYDKEDKIYNFMGRLNIEGSCFQCHYNQNYNVGDLKGGIRVSIPASLYQSELSNLKSHFIFELTIIGVISTLSYFLVFFIIKKVYKNQEKLKHLTEKYQLLNTRYDHAVEGSKIGIWDWNIKTNEVYFSKEWKAMLGFKEDELNNHLSIWDEKVHPDDKEKAYCDIKANQNKETVFYENIHRLKHKDGTWVWILDRGKTFFDKDGKALRMIGSHTNITQIKKLEEELQAKEDLMIAQSRHAAMGEMISMIAHQWRQPISVVEMAANNILVDIELGMIDEESLKDSANSMIEQTEYLSKTIEDFRNFFKPNKSKEIVLPSQIIKETIKIVGKSLENNNINVILNVKSEVEIQCYSRELLQVFINLIKNAKEAFENKDIENKNIEITIFKKSKTIRIELYDNAGKIEEEILDKIFEPYFSTKSEKAGTGLGLYMSKTIVEKHHNAVLDVYNINDGVCFYLELDL